MTEHPNPNHCAREDCKNPPLRQSYFCELHYFQAIRAGFFGDRSIEESRKIVDAGIEKNCAND